MLEFPRWKYVLILLVLVFSAVYALPNIYPQDPSVQITASRGAAIDEALKQKVTAALGTVQITPKQLETRDGDLLVRLSTADAQTKANDVLRASLGENYTVALNLASTVPHWLSSLGAKPMVRGLDLQGGVHFTLQVDQKAALDKRVEAFVEDARVTLRDAKIRTDSVLRGPNNSILVNVAQGQDVGAARNALSTALAASTGSASGTLVGASPLTYDVQGNRITIGLPESELARISGDAIAQNIATLRNRVNALGVAEPVIQQQGADRIVVELPGVQDTAAAKRLIGATATIEFRAVVDGDAMEAQRTGNVPPEAKLYTLRDVGAPVLLNKRVLASGEQMVNAVSNVDQNGQPAVDITLNSVAGKRMFDFTSTNVGKRMAVVYIERIPEVFQTTGLSKDEADNLAKLLRAGSLAAPMGFVEEYVIGPSLGAENVERGIKAVVYSFLFTLVFFTIYYRVFGAITSVALLFNLLIVVAVMSLFGATMTLPGFAGLALSVGLSVDANVLINERIREELRNGMPAKSAISAGYEKAGGTILDANLTGLIVGIALFAFGTGPLRGFALTMIIGIFASMFTAITVSRAIAVLLYGRRKKLTSVAI
jgi:preprotein translocase subunit SecD